MPGTGGLIPERRPSGKIDWNESRSAAKICQRLAVVGDCFGLIPLLAVIRWPLFLGDFFW